MADPDFISDLVRYPRESLSTEVKAWFDPSTPEGHAKIVRCALAMRNHGGGVMLIGFDNATGDPVANDRPADVRVAFHIDRIQGLITRFASESFEVAVHFIERDGSLFPVVEIPQGIRTPVASKSSLTDSAGRQLIRENRVYVRTLDANNTPSSSEAIWKDWNRIVETCFDNREADIGRFLRRHLSGLSASVLRELAANLQEAVAHHESDEEALRRVLDQGLGRFRQIVSDRHLELPQHGSWEIAAIVRGERPPTRPNLEFLGALLSSNPNYTGWPVWLDSRNFGDQTARPYLANDVWEAFIASFDSGWSNHLDFWRLSPAGEFYLYRAFQDDVSVSDRHPAPMTEFDFGLPVIRSAEAVGVSLAYARALGTSGPEAAVLLGFRWTGLQGRELSAWAQPLRHISPGRHAYRDEVFSTVAIPLETPLSAVHQFVHAATESLFEAFDGFQLSQQVVEDLTNRLFQRRL
jgi:hypothetical protein